MRKIEPSTELDSVRTAYRQAYERTGDKAIALVEAAVVYTFHTGVSPTSAELDHALRGAILGTDHVLMRLLDGPRPARRKDDAQS